MAYYKYLHGQPYLVFKKSTFLNDLEILPPEIAYPLVALTLRFLPGGATGSSDVRDKMEENWTRRAWDIIMSRIIQGGVNLSHLQGLCLLIQKDIAGSSRFILRIPSSTLEIVTNLFVDGKTHRACVNIGLGNRLIKAAGMTRRQSFSQDNPSKEEERRRCTWTFFMLDRIHSASLFHSLSSKDSHFHLSLPILENDMTDEKIQLSGILMPHPDSEGSKIDLGIFAYLVRLVGIWGKVADYMVDRSSTPPWKTGSKYLAIESVLLEFESTFPARHRYMQVNFTTQAPKQRELISYYSSWLFLQIIYHGIVLVLNHPFLLLTQTITLSRQLPASFIHKCYEQAQIHSRLILKHVEEMVLVDIKVHDPFIAYIIVVATTVQIQSCYSDNQQVALAASRNVDIALQYLTYLSQFWKNVGTMVYVFNSV